MRVRTASLVILVAFLLSAPAMRANQAHEHPAGDPTKLGKVNFPISCDEQTKPVFNQAVAMLHSFWYEKAAETFSAVAKRDPGCGMAYWGVAMSHYHPLWEQPGAASLKAGASAVEKAKAAGAKSDRERDFIKAIGAFYKDFASIDHVSRVQEYEQAMEALHRRYPEDREGAIFYALSLLGTATALPPDPTYAKQRQAGELLTRLFAGQPDHPGLTHYIIHSYDYPGLAPLALESARRYAKIAPDSPHALHMPSHIFTRLGLWEESIASNLDSAAAARRHKVPGDGLHAKDYLMYAYLQRGQDRAAKKLLDDVPENQPGTSHYFAGLFALAAMPARYVLERRDWAGAAALKTPAGTFPGGRYAFTEAIFAFARGLGAARTGKLEAARESITELASLRETVLEAKETYWAEQVEVQRQIVAAWIALAEHNQEEALRLMRSAADLEDRLGKHPVTPGAVLPARELLGDMLLELKQPVQALREFEAVLETVPHRLNALHGAARASEAAGEAETAKKYYAQLAELTADGDGDRPELEAAKRAQIEE